MNNEDLKKFLKENINLDCPDCLQEIKNTEVEVLPCTLKRTYNYGKAIRYGLYGVLGLSILGSSSYTAYNYVTPQTFINIEVMSPEITLSNDPHNDDFTIQLKLNGFDKVIDVYTNKDVKTVCDISNLDFIEAYPKVIQFIRDNTSYQKNIVFTVLSNNEKKSFTIEEALKEFESHFIHVNDSKIEDSKLTIGQKKAIHLILKKTDKYTKEELEQKSLKELIEILFLL